MGPKQQVAQQLVGNLLFGALLGPFFWVGPKQQVAKQLVDNLLFGVHWVPFLGGAQAAGVLGASWDFLGASFEASWACLGGVLGPIFETKAN